MIKAQTGDIIMKTLPQNLVFSSVKNIARMMKTVEHSNGHGTIARGGSLEYVRVNLMLQKAKPILGLAEKKVSQNSNISLIFSCQKINFLKKCDGNYISVSDASESSTTTTLKTTTTEPTTSTTTTIDLITTTTMTTSTTSAERTTTTATTTTTTTIGKSLQIF